LSRISAATWGFYRQDYKTAMEELLTANQNDPFIQCLLGQTYEKVGEKDKAIESYRKAAAAIAHNPPAAYASLSRRNVSLL